jgi:hypothetical protein
MGYLSQFMASPHEEHLAAVKHILRYVARIRGYGLHYEKNGGTLKLISYSDVDMAGDIDTRKSTSGIIFLISQGQPNHLAIHQVEGHCYVLL